MSVSTIKTIACTSLALLAFAGNSILCRLALATNTIDAASFTIIRLLSGSIASGVGYAVWYIALGQLSVIQAAVVQLFVPVLAAIGGLIFAHEFITMRLVISATMILGGILIVVLGRYYFIQRKHSKEE
ncbi:MAG: hypothetical protein methR_P2113 [Methyloprofundus sp.]|nr:MAG: hypothetical protein methR_P2113 [Methyloprofundus sp.]